MNKPSFRFLFSSFAKTVFFHFRVRRQ